MSEVCSDKVTSARIFSHSSDPSDSDYIQNHIDSFFPSDDFTKEVIDEDNENPSGAVVSIISGEVDADEAEKILDMLLNREYDEDDEFEDRSANYQVLEKPMTTGIHTDVIQLIPWTGFEMGELGDEPGDWTDVFDEWFDYITDLLDDIADLLVSGFAYVAEFLTNLDEILKDWGMRVIGAISDAFSAVKDAVSEVGELMSALADWIVSHVSSLFSRVWDGVISGLESWAEGIQEAMEGFFEELAEWDEMDGSESMEDTMEAGTGLMLSFIGQQDRGKQITDVIMRIMRFIEPFQEYISPMGIIEIISDASEFGGYFSEVESLIGGAISEVIGGFMEIVFWPDGYLGVAGVWETALEEGEVSEPLFSIDAPVNFLEEAGFLTGMVEILMDGAADFINEVSEASKTNTQSIANLISGVIPISMGLVSILISLYTGDIGMLNLITSGLSIVLSVVTGMLGNVLFSLTSAIVGMWLSFVGIIGSLGEPTQLSVGLIEFFGTPWFFLLGVV